MPSLRKAFTKLSFMATHPARHSWAMTTNRCNICGRPTVFLCDEPKDRWIRRCVWCRSTPKYRAILLAVERQLGKPLQSLLDSGGRVYEATTTSPIFRRFYGQPNYFCSGYFFDKPFGEALEPNFFNQDLQRLSFADGSFDVMISSETMEHVRKPWQAFAEIWRILKPGGFHVFTIPYNEDRPTVPRVDTSGPEDVDLLPKVYHQDPYRTSDSLVYTDFGADLVTLLKPIGFETVLHRLWEPAYDIRDDLQPVRVFVSVKPLQ